jgi:hypothetical protein
MSQFFRIPREWHNSLDASLPPVYPVDFMPGSKNARISRRLVHCLGINSPLKKWEFCKTEGITLATLNSAIHACPALLWEDGGQVGLA